MDLMMRLSNVKARAVVTNKVALEAEQPRSKGRSGERGLCFGASDEKTTE